MNVKINLSLAVIVVCFTILSSTASYGEDCQILSPNMYHKASNKDEPGWLMPEFDDADWSETNGFQRYCPPAENIGAWEPNHSYQYYRIWVGIGEEIKSVNMILNAGYDVHVYINGRYFGSTWTMGTNLTGGEIITRLNKGLNLIALQVQVYDDIEAPCGFLDFSIRLCDQPILEVPIDIQPGTCFNPLDIDSKGKLTVAVAGSKNFDVREINSVRLNGIPPLHSFIEDVSKPDFCYDFKPDEIDDLVLEFETQKVVETLGKVSVGEVISLTISGTSNSGTKFEGKDVATILKK